MKIKDLERFNKLNKELKQLQRMLELSSYSSSKNCKERKSYLIYNGSKLEEDKYTGNNFITIPESMFKPLVKKLKKHYQQCIIEVESEINNF